MNAYTNLENIIIFNSFMTVHDTRFLKIMIHNSSSKNFNTTSYVSLRIYFPLESIARDGKRSAYCIYFTSFLIGQDNIDSAPAAISCREARAKEESANDGMPRRGERGEAKEAILG